MQNIKSIVNGDFSHVPKCKIQEALVEYYSRRSPYVYIHNNNKSYNQNIIHVVEIEEEKNDNNNKEIEKNKKDFRDIGIQTDNTEKDKYKYIFEIKDKRKRRSTAWKMYKDLCSNLSIEPVLRYPDGDDRDYIKLIIKLENEHNNK